MSTACYGVQRRAHLQHTEPRWIQPGARRIPPGQENLNKPTEGLTSRLAKNRLNPHSSQLSWYFWSEVKATPFEALYEAGATDQARPAVNWFWPRPEKPSELAQIALLGNGSQRTPPSRRVHNPRNPIGAFQKTWAKSTNGMVYSHFGKAQ